MIFAPSNPITRRLAIINWTYLLQSVDLKYPEWKLWANRKDGLRPRDRPECGFHGEMCSNGISSGESPLR